MYTIYLLHFDKPYWNNCQHYLGYTSLPLEERIQRHKNGNGSKLVSYALRNGNDFEVTVIAKLPTQLEARQEELRLKRSGHFRRICGVCNSHKKSATCLSRMIS